MPDNEPGASTRVIEKLNLRKGRLPWTVIVASERQRERKRECMRLSVIERERINERMNKRMEERISKKAGRPNERERDCRANMKGRLCSSKSNERMFCSISIRVRSQRVCMYKIKHVTIE